MNNKIEVKWEQNPEKGGINGVLGVILDAKWIKNASKNQYTQGHLTNL